MPASKKAAKKLLTTRRRVLDARPDTLDFRDLMFEPTLVEVPTIRPLEDYLKIGVGVLNQGAEGACTGFGLATVVHFLLRTRSRVPDTNDVSPRMLYEMARRYDEWPGVKYSGSSARGAMKGWHKHGVCSAKHWIYDSSLEDQDSELFSSRFSEALHRPLGAYFRVNHKDIVAIHTAISEVNILYATAQVHTGWDDVSEKGEIEWDNKQRLRGWHAFAVVGYDRVGFWIQNSWGNDWGRKGFAQITYDDWLANASDVWVARLGAPIELHSREAASLGVGVAAQGTRSYVFCALRPHVISLGNEGTLREEGTYGTSKSDVEELFQFVSQRASAPDGPTRVLLYAHGGLTAEDSAIQKIADLRAPLLAAGVYPISLIWKTDFWSTLKNILQDGVNSRRPEGILDSAKDFMLDRLDDAMEPLARALGGKSQWDEMKENAIKASKGKGGLLIVLDELKKLLARHPSIEIHLAGCSAGSILLGGLVKAANGSEVKFRTCTLWAPACTIDFFRQYYLPAITTKAVDKFAVFALSDRVERDDHCASIYHKSLLYLVSHAFERFLRQPPFLTTKAKRDGEPLLGMEKWAVPERDRARQKWDIILSPNEKEEGHRDSARATAHGDFDDDEATLRATLARILDRQEVEADFGKGRQRSTASNRSTRAVLVRDNPMSGTM